MRMQVADGSGQDGEVRKRSSEARKTHQCAFLRGVHLFLSYPRQGSVSCMHVSRGPGPGICISFPPRLISLAPGKSRAEEVEYRLAAFTRNRLPELSRGKFDAKDLDLPVRKTSD